MIEASGHIITCRIAVRKCGYRICFHSGIGKAAVLLNPPSVAVHFIRTPLHGAVVIIAASFITVHIVNDGSNQLRIFCPGRYISTERVPGINMCDTSVIHIAGQRRKRQPVLPAVLCRLQSTVSKDAYIAGGHICPVGILIQSKVIR